MLHIIEREFLYYNYYYEKTSIITLITISAIAVSGLSFAAPTYASCNDTNISGQTIRVHLTVKNKNLTGFL